MKVSNWSGAPNYYDLAGNLRTGNRDCASPLDRRRGFAGQLSIYLRRRRRLGQLDDTASSSQFRTSSPRRLKATIRSPWEKRCFPPDGWPISRSRLTTAPQTLEESNLKNVTLQFGGPSGYGFPSVAQRRHGLDLLNEKRWNPE